MIVLVTKAISVTWANPFNLFISSPVHYVILKEVSLGKLHRSLWL